MKKNTVKKIFIFFLIYLPLQYAAVGLVGPVAGEPWPAFVLPAFQNTDATPRYVAVMEPAIAITDTEGNRVEKIPLQSVFPGIPKSQLRGFLRTHFADSLQWSAKTEAASYWLRHNVDENYSSLQPRYLHAYWEKKYYNFSKGISRVDSTEIIEAFAISLDDEPK